MATLTEPMVLPSDVALAPVADLPADIRSHIDCDENDFAITRKYSRTPSKVISPDLAGLVGVFRSPATIAEAVIRFSSDNDTDPHDVLENAFPLLKQLIVARLLVPEDSDDAVETDAAFTRGDRAAGFDMLRCIQLLEDTELYQALTEDGRRVALKIMPATADPPESLSPLLEHESAVLRHLDGQVSPEFVASGQHDGRPYLAMTWASGVPVTQLAAELRDQAVEASRAELLELCVAVLEAYSHLHSQGVLHGDVHPNNLLVDADCQVRLVDFGLARVLDPSAGVSEPGRGGVGFFLDPQYAAAMQAGRAVPVTTVGSEIYCLGVLLYQLMTGLHYLDFSLGEEQMLRQITTDPPLSFESRRTAPWPAVEAALARALEKEPDRRFPDVATFAEALRRAGSAPAVDTGPAATVTSPARLDPAAEALLTDVLKRLSIDGPLVDTGLSQAPTASINFGSAGIAYGLYRISVARGDPELLSLADVWATRAARRVDDPSGFYNGERELGPEVLGAISAYHTPSGVHAVQSLIAHAMGDLDGQAAALERFVAAADQPCTNLDLTLGRSSVLVTGALLHEALPDPRTAGPTGLLALGERTLRDIWDLAATYPPVREPAPGLNLGMAHGWAGLLYAALRWCTATGTPVPAQIRERLDQLGALSEYTGRGAQWPWELTPSDSGYMPGWCNGSAGYVFLWTLAARTFDDPSYQVLADKAAWNCWEDPDQAANLCCGLAGRSYALLHHYRQTRVSAWLERARSLAGPAAISIRDLPTDENADYANSLYKGDVGVAVLLADLATPDAAVMPFFESEFD